MRINYLFNLIGYCLPAATSKRHERAMPRCAALIDGKTDARSAFVERVPAGPLRIARGDPALAWREYEAAFEAVMAIGETSMQRKLPAARAQLAEDAGSASRLDAAVTALAAPARIRPGG